MLLPIVSQGTMSVAYLFRALQSQERWAMFLSNDHRSRSGDLIVMFNNKAFR